MNEAPEDAGSGLAGAGPAWLFCPADRADRFEKAAAAADVVILDLEDGVAPADRAAARTNLIATPLDPDRTVVRINPAGRTDHFLDLAALGETAYATIMLAKSESAAEVSSLEPYAVVALCETPRGVLRAAEIAAQAAVIGLMWGAEDLIAGLGGRTSRFPSPAEAFDTGGLVADPATEGASPLLRGPTPGASGPYREVARHARSTVLIAAAAFGKFALDAVHLDIKDLEGLRTEAEDAAASGFSATACIHPGQLAVVRAGYQPTADAVRWARRVLKAAESAPGVFAFEGKMVDEPVLRQARRMLRAAGVARAG